MTIKKVGVKSFVLIFLLSIGFWGYLESKPTLNTVRAATAPRIYVQSSKTSFLSTEYVTATVVIDGGTQAFTAFKANVALSNLSIVSGPTLGPSISNWQTEPTSASLNFFGGVQGTTTNIAVYSVILKPTKVGTSSIDITSGAIYQVQGDGMTVTDILEGQDGATYTVTSPPNTSTPTSTPAPTSPDTSTDTPNSTPTSTDTSSVPVAPTPEKATVTPPPQTTSGNLVIPSTVATTPSTSSRGYLWWAAWISFFIGLSSAIAVLIIKKVKMRRN